MPQFQGFKGMDDWRGLRMLGLGNWPLQGLELQGERLCPRLVAVIGHLELVNWIVEGL